MDAADRGRTLFRGHAATAGPGLRGQWVLLTSRQRTGSAPQTPWRNERMTAQTVPIPPHASTNFEIAEHVLSGTAACWWRRAPGRTPLDLAIADLVPLDLVLTPAGAGMDEARRAPQSRRVGADDAKDGSRCEVASDPRVTTSKSQATPDDPYAHFFAGRASGGNIVIIASTNQGRVTQPLGSGHHAVGSTPARHIFLSAPTGKVGADALMGVVAYPVHDFSAAADRAADFHDAVVGEWNGTTSASAIPSAAIRSSSKILRHVLILHSLP